MVDARKPDLAELQRRKAAGKRLSLEEYLKIYDPEKSPHPWIHYVKAIPMGGQRVPMNHSLEVLNLIAIHLERIGFPEPVPEKQEIKYIPPTEGPNVVYNPGTWVDKDAPDPVPAELPTVSLEGVPQAQIDILKQAIQREEVRKLKISNADPNARIAAEMTTTDKNVTVLVDEAGTAAATANPPVEPTASAAQPQPEPGPGGSP